MSSYPNVTAGVVARLEGRLTSLDKSRSGERFSFSRRVRLDNRGIDQHTCVNRPLYYKIMRAQGVLAWVQGTEALQKPGIDEKILVRSGSSSLPYSVESNARAVTR